MLLVACYREANTTVSRSAHPKAVVALPAAGGTVCWSRARTFITSNFHVIIFRHNVIKSCRVFFLWYLFLWFYFKTIVEFLLVYWSLYNVKYVDQNKFLFSFPYYQMFWNEKSVHPFATFIIMCIVNAVIIDNIKHDYDKVCIIHGRSTIVYIDGLVQDCSICSALAMEILQSYTKPSISTWIWKHV